jgi:acetoacetyl-CoA synthetase
VPEGASTETRLRAIWENVLAVEPIRADDNFFDIGGTSLIAVRLFHLIESDMAIELPLSTLLDAPTIAEMAALIDDPQQLVEPLVLLRPGEGGRPLFFIHSMWGDVLEMRTLALQMESGVPVYGLRARGLNPGEQPQGSVEEMARTYIETIRGVQPTGPYRLSGYSFGGLVSYEIAGQLSAMGETVEWLGLIDAEVDPNALPRAARWRYKLARPFHLIRWALESPRTSFPRFFRRVIKRVAPWAPIDEAPPEWMGDEPPLTRQIALACEHAATLYRPKPYQGPVTYFLPRVRRLGLFCDPMPVWTRVIEGGMEIERVGGEHLEMVAPANAPALASRIDSHLAAAGGEAKREHVGAPTCG